MMKALISILLFFGFTSIFAQTTTTYYKPDSTIQGKQTYKDGKRNGVYKRWYDNRRKHWIVEYKDNALHGTAKFYNRRGKLVLEEVYEEGKLIQTVFQSENYFVITGNINFSSKVVGGAIREDGTVNVSKHGGPLSYFDMFLANVDSLSAPTVFYDFTTDRFGDYAVCVKKGKYGVFPGGQDKTTISPGQFKPSRSSGMSSESGWKTSLIVVNNISLHDINFSRYSIGYAP